jgi:signal transduction histidine kinase
MLLIATAMVWLTAYAAWTADWIIEPMPWLFARSMLRIPMVTLGASLCGAIALTLDRLAARPFALRLAAALGLVAFASAAYALANHVMFHRIAPWWGPAYQGEWQQEAIVVAWVFLAWTALYFAIDADAGRRDAQLRLAGAETASLRAQNQALAQQISPHFLFNALNAASGLILEGQPARAERVLMALSNLLRRSLEAEARETIPLGEEIQALHRYLEIEEARFEDRLRFVDTVPDETRSLAVPPMILQPLVENAVKHGVARTSRIVTLTLGAAREGGGLVITISDDAVPDDDAAPTSGTGIGHENVRRRLGLIYGDRAAFDAGPLDRGYAARLRIPADA